MAEIRLHELVKRFGPVTALNDLSLDVAAGELVVLLGPTGAGKTTTLRLIAGLESPDEGQVYIDGREVTADSIASRDVAFVFQQFSLYPHYTVFDNLAFPLRSPLRRMAEPAIRERVTHIAHLLRIEAKLGNRATTLSGGEMQRVAIGRALVREPAAFLMDEPLSSLDAKLREDLRVELKRIQRDLGATILYVTHDQMEAMTLADRIGVLIGGRLLQLGSPEDIYQRPATVQVAQRLGSPSINLLPAGALEVAAPAGTVQVGVRPEDVEFGNGGEPAEVVQVEPLGAETVIVLDLAGHRLHALAGASRQPACGERLAVGCRSEAMLFFDRAGRRLETRQ